MSDNIPPQPAVFWGYLFDHLRRITTFRQVLITLLLAVCTLAGSAAWEYRRELALAAVSKFGTPEIDTSHTEEVATELMRTTGAQTISIWSVNMQSNELTLLYFRQGDTRMTQYEGLSGLAFREDREHPGAVIRLLNRKTDCGQAVTASGEDIIPATPGVTYTCAASIPPTHGIFLGFIAAGFNDKPAQPDYVKMRLASAAQKMMK